MKTVTKVLACMLVFCTLFSLVACGGGGGAQTTGDSATISGSNTSGTAGAGIGAQDAAKVDLAWEDLSAMDKVYRLMDQYPLMFNGLGPQQYGSRAGVEKALGNVPLKDNPADYVIGHSGGAMNSPYFINLIESATKQCEEYGMTVITQLNGGNAELRYQQIDAFITQKVDAIMSNGDPTTDEPYFRRAVEAGIPVVVTSAQMMQADNPVVTNILCSGFVAGFFVGEYLGEYMVTEAAKIRPEFADHDYIWQIGHAVFGLAFGDSQSRNCGIYSGFLYYLAEYDGHPYADKWEAIVDGATLWAKVIDMGKYNVADDNTTDYIFGNIRINVRGYGQGAPDSPGGQAAVQDLIVAHPDLDLCLFDCDPMYPGGEVVLNQNGKYPGQNIWVATAADGTPFGMEKLKSGEIIAIGNNSSLMNGYGMGTIMRDIFIARRDMNNIIPNLYTPTVAITAENVDDYYSPDLTMARGIPYEIEDIDQYNARMKIAIEKGDPFYYPGFWISNEEWRGN